MRYFHRYGRQFDWLFPKRMWRVSDGPSDVLYLTFDDGPVPGVTESILDILKSYGIKATFFCVGDNVAKHPIVYKRIIEEGHAVGNHTYNHLDEHESGYYQYLRNVVKGRKILKSLGDNQSIELFRPPYGRLSRRTEKALKGLKVVMWSVLTGDFDPNLDREECLRKSIESTIGKDIVVFHDNNKMRDKVLWVLPRYIDSCLEKGFRFERL